MTVVSRSLTIAVVTSVLLLTACTGTSTTEPGAAGSATPTPLAPSDSPSVSASATPTPDANTPPDLSSLTLTTEGLGSLVVGSPVPDQESPASLVTWDADYCAGLPTPDGNWAGAFVPVYPQAESPALGERDAFVTVTAEGNTTSRIMLLRVQTPEVLTAENIGVGSTREELLAAYPSFDATTTEQISDTYAVDGDAGRLVFEVAKKTSAPFENYWEPELIDTVLWVSVFPIETPPVAVAGGDGGSPCVV